MKDGTIFFLGELLKPPPFNMEEGGKKLSKGFSDVQISTFSIIRFFAPVLKSASLLAILISAGNWLKSSDALHLKLFLTSSDPGAPKCLIMPLSACLVGYW